MKKLSLSSIVSLSVFLAQAQNEQVLGPTNTAFVLREVFPEKLKNTASIAALDRFGRQTEISWIRTQSRLGYGVIQEKNTSGRDLFKKSFLNGVRETAADWPQGRDWEDWAEESYAWAVGNTPEEGLNPSAVTPSASESSWWRRSKYDGVISYGPRPMEGEPYYYVNARFGHWRGEPLFILHSRVYYRPFDEMKVDFNALLSLSPYGQISGGVSLNPLRIGEDGDNYSVRYTYGIFSDKTVTNKRWTKSISFFAGYGFNQHNSNFQVGLFCPWPS